MVSKLVISNMIYAFSLHFMFSVYEVEELIFTEMENLTHSKILPSHSV